MILHPTTSLVAEFAAAVAAAMAAYRQRHLVMAVASRARSFKWTSSISHYRFVSMCFLAA
jgi:hypothetical protein